MEILKQGKFEKLAPNVTETSSLMVAAAERESKSTKKLQVQDALTAAAEGKALQLEEKAAKIERLKSGFRICKPQGTFLWPNMVKSSNSSSIDNSSSFVQVQVEVPTPPSVSSSTVPPQLPYHHQPAPSIVKPLAEKRAVTVTVSTLSNTTPAALVNLNDAPINLDNDAKPPVSSQVISELSIYLSICARNS